MNSSINSASQRRKKSKNDDTKYEEFEQPPAPKSGGKLKKQGSKQGEPGLSIDIKGKPGKNKKGNQFEEESVISDTVVDPYSYVEEPEQPKVVNQNPFVSQRIVPFGTPSKHSNQQNSNSKQKSNQKGSGTNLAQSGQTQN